MNGIVKIRNITALRTDPWKDGDSIVGTAIRLVGTPVGNCKSPSWRTVIPTARESANKGKGEDSASNLRPVSEEVSELFELSTTEG